MKVIAGRIGTDGNRVVSWWDESGEHPLDLRLDLSSHSPTGFHWGYCGSGPAQLALAILALVAEDDELACEGHQAFKRDVIACIPQSMGWMLTDDSIKNWITVYRNGDSLRLRPLLLLQKRMASWNAHG